jgi:AraC-like DNA-binding protein
MTITLGDISVRYVNQMLTTAESLGLDKQDFCNQFQLDDSLLTQSEARISIPKYMRLGRTIIEETGAANFGLLMGSQAEISLLGIAGLTAMTASTAEEALMDITRFEALSSTNARGRSRFYFEKNLAVSEFYSISPYNEFNFFIVDLALALQWNLLNKMTEQLVTPLRVDIEFPEPPYADDYQVFFGCTIRFNQPRNALVFKKSTLKVQPTLRNPLTHNDCIRLCQKELKKQDQYLSFQDKVKKEISPLLHTEKLTIEQVALRLDMPVWTLQRKLKREGESFKDLLDDTRHSLSLIYLKDHELSLGEIAYLLGFSSPNAFQRAFKRWQGIPPGEYRTALKY